VHERESFTPLLQSERGEVWLVVTDRNGTPRELVDERGAIAWAATYLSWGRIDREWRSKRGGGVRSPFRLLGQYFDDETGLAATRFRYWDPATARWLSQDPLRIRGGRNLFGFDGNPLLHTDPLGLSLQASVETNGETVFEGEYDSGAEGTAHEGQGSLDQQEALETHTEPKFLSDVRDGIENGTIDPENSKGIMNGELPPCQPGCQPAIRNFVNDTGMPMEYNEPDGTKWEWQKVDGMQGQNGPVNAEVVQTKTNPDGTTETRRYWTPQSQTPSE
jgi:RHS repeat-associated protein